MMQLAGIVLVMGGQMGLKLNYLLVLLLLIPAISWGDCGGASPTWTAASCSDSDIQDCLDEATLATDDVVSVPSGTCEWTADVTISDSIILQGAGIDVTTVYTDSGTSPEYFLKFGLTDDVRITGFTFQEVSLSGYGDGFRIDHNELYSTTAGRTGFDTTPTDGVTQYSHPYGLIDNNEFYNGRIVIYGSAQNVNENANTLATLDTDLGGSDDTIYIEDNSFTRPLSTAGNAIDGNDNGQYVFRYNTLYGQYVEAHSMQGNNRGHKKWEVYGNTLENNPAVAWIYAMRFRGGTGVVFANYFEGAWSGDVGLDNVRSYSDVSDGGLCDGDSTWDGNEDATGYPCRDQIGRGPDDPLWVSSPVGAYAQALEPAYFWGNELDSGTFSIDILNSCEDHIQADRDFYTYTGSFDGTSGVGCGTLGSRPATCTAGVAYWATDQSCTDMTGMVGDNPSTEIAGTLWTCDVGDDAWTNYFTPYTYPHPLQDSTTTITSISGATLQGVTIQ